MMLKLSLDGAGDYFEKNFFKNMEKRFTTSHHLHIHPILLSLIFLGRKII